MDEIRPGTCMLWKPATNGVPALVTVISLDLDNDRAQIHVTRASTQTCAPHWVDMNLLSKAPVGASACACVAKLNPKEQGNDAA
jgi:hypothetical protein